MNKEETIHVLIMFATIIAVVCTLSDIQKIVNKDTKGFASYLEFGVTGFTWGFLILLLR